MTKQQASPQYLPAINSRLEYQAGLLPTGLRAARPTSKNAVELASKRPWLGADFTHTVESR